MWPCWDLCLFCWKPQLTVPTGRLAHPPRMSGAANPGLWLAPGGAPRSSAHHEKGFNQSGLTIFIYPALVMEHCCCSLKGSLSSLGEANQAALVKQSRQFTIMLLLLYSSDADIWRYHKSKYTNFTACWGLWILYKGKAAPRSLRHPKSCNIHIHYRWTTSSNKKQGML